MNVFDKKFGELFIESVPIEPGVYRFFAETGVVIYVGKAKSLRRRLSQYRKPKRSKRHKKMRAIVKEAVRLEFEIHTTDLDACLKEMRLIQELRPSFNVVGAFTFLYPYLGIKASETNVSFCLTTTPSGFADFQCYGAFRSRETVAEAFFALMRLLQFIGHKMKRNTKEVIPAHSYVFHFRKMPLEWAKLWDPFFRGQSRDALEDLILRLLQNAGARAKAEEIQEGMDALKRFWKREAKPLAEAILAMSYPDYPVPQLDRDPLFLSYRAKEA